MGHKCDACGQATDEAPTADEGRGSMVLCRMCGGDSQPVVSDEPV